MQKHLIVVGGPTASGKTALAIQLAQQYNTEIISADSRQFYREMSIGTAKPEAAELAQVKHHFIDSLSIMDDYSVGDFERDAILLLEQLYSTRDVVVVAGGSGLFINALCNGIDQFPAVSNEVKEEVARQEQTKGIEWLQSTLQSLDPVYFEQVDQYNTARLRRAVEVSLSSGAPYSSFLGKDRKPRIFKPILLQPDWPRAELYERINQRVDQMIARGLEDEARSLLSFRHRPALATVGYEEWFSHFDGATNRTETIVKIKQHTRNYAKRQLSWFRKYRTWNLVDPKIKENFNKILAPHIP